MPTEKRKQKKAAEVPTNIVTPPPVKPSGKKVDSTIKKLLGKKKKITAKDKISAKEMKKVVKVLKKNEVPPETPFHFTGLDKKKYKVNPQQKKFCDIYMSLSGNGQDAAIEAGYNVYNSRGDINYNLAASIASENLTKPNIVAYITKTMHEYGFEDENIKKHHLFIINQFADIKTKAKGIDMYYKLKGDYAAQKIEHGVNEKVEEALERIAKILP